MAGNAVPRESCPSCGAGVEVPVDGWTRCPDCGFEVSHSGSSQAEPAREPSQEGPTATRDHGSTGEDRDPVIVVILTLFTLGIYRLYWLWVVSKEIDDYDPDAKSAHKLVKIGMVVIVVAAVVVMISLLGIAGSGALDRGPPTTGTQAALAGLGIFMFLAVVALFVAFLLLLIGEYRIWTKIRDDEVRCDVRDKLDPVIQLVLVLVPLVNIIGIWIALYRAQDHLNDVWARAEQGTAPQTV